MFRVERERRVGAEISRETAYGLVSMPRERAGAAEVLAHLRDHWGIENRLHYPRDVSLREDACRVRKGSASQLMAILRNLVVFLVRRRGWKALPEAMRHYVCHPEKSIEVLSSRK